MRSTGVVLVVRISARILWLDDHWRLDDVNVGFYWIFYWILDGTYMGVIGSQFHLTSI